MCGITGGLCITMLLIGFIFPFATYACPAVAAYFILPIVYEYKEKTAFTLYAAVSFLAIIMVPDYELSFMFIFVFGLYTVIKFFLDRKIKNKLLRIIVKLLYVNVALAISYGILLFIFPVAAIVNEFSGYSLGFTAMIFIMLNMVFFLYDKSAESVLLLYIYKLRPKLFKKR